MVVDQGLSDISNALIYSAMLAYTISFLGFVVDLSGRGKKAQPVEVAVPVRVGAGPEDAAGPVEPTASTPPARSRALGVAISTMYLGFALHLGGVIARGLSVHRAPWGNMYEFSIAFATGIVGGYLFLARRYQIRALCPGAR